MGSIKECSSQRGKEKVDGDPWCQGTWLQTSGYSPQVEPTPLNPSPAASGSQDNHLQIW